MGNVRFRTTPGTTGIMAKRGEQVRRRCLCRRHLEGQPRKVTINYGLALGALLSSGASRRRRHPCSIRLRSSRHQEQPSTTTHRRVVFFAGDSRRRAGDSGPRKSLWRNSSPRLGLAWDPCTGTAARPIPEPPSQRSTIFHQQLLPRPVRRRRRGHPRYTPERRGLRRPVGQIPRRRSIPGEKFGKDIARETCNGRLPASSRLPDHKTRTCGSPRGT